MTPKELQDRTKRFALGVMELCKQLQPTQQAQHCAGQLFRAATSVAANYRAACRGRSRAEFAAKLSTVVEEADESAFWLEFLVDRNLLSAEQAQRLRKEADELTAIFVQSRNTVTRRR